MLLIHPDCEDDDTVKLGLLTFKAVVRGLNHKRVAALFQCDCGRFLSIPTRVLGAYAGGVDGTDKVADLPWSCEACDYTKPSMKGYRPWRPQHPLSAVVPVPPELRVPSCIKNAHPKEWYAWQQAKRLSKGVVTRWKTFKWFHKDLGDAPQDGVLTKRNTQRPHGPRNSYWKVPTDLKWGDTVVTTMWLKKQYNVPRHYTVRCKAVGVLDAMWIQTRYHQGYPPPKPGEYSPQVTVLPITE